MQENKSFAELSQGKFTIADVFEVSLSYLDTDEELKNYTGISSNSGFSCDAISYAISELLELLGYPDEKRYNIPGDTLKVQEQLEIFVQEGLINMGLYFETLNAFEDVENPQQARSIWFAWCKMMAEEQGV